MPRLSLGFDNEQFLNHCRMTKPPYECPHASCGKVYRSFTGIFNHMNSFDHENPPANIGTMKYGCYDPEPLPIPMSTDLKCVEFELDGKLTTISVFDPIEIVSKEFYEASIPPCLEESSQDISKTPSLKSQGKTPKNRSKDKDRGVDVQRYTIEEKKSPKLPEAAFKIIPGYYDSIPDAPKRHAAYYKFVEKSSELLDEEVEYDMDEEDRAWLDIMNSKRAKDKLNRVSMESFELLMDRLEKESFFQAQSTGREPGAPIDEDAVCCICMDGECQNSNVILFCDMCNLAVHQECYGVPYIPEGQWLCRRCLQSPSRAVDCALCPNKGGAFKQTDDGRWAHVVCAMWIPEVCFANTVFLEPIDSIGNIPPARWKLTCYICVQRGVGACIQCNKVNCYTAFHVTCAQQAGLHMKIDAIREINANGTSVTVRKAAYCDMHTPADSDARPQVEELMDSAKKAAAKAASRQKMKKARKILAEKRSAAPIVSVPTLPADSRVPPYCWGIVNSLPVPSWEKIQQLAKLVEIDKRALFIHRLLAFWTLKRQSRNGVPLLRRLTTSYSRRNMGASPTHRNPSPNLHRKSPQTIRKRPDTSPPQVPSTLEEITRGEKFREEIKYWQRLRQDLERARLLCELIRKREKTKRELVQAQSEERLVQLAPLVHLLLQKIDLLQEADGQEIFAEPVDFEEVPDYLDVVKHPMDLSTMRQKAQAHQYHNVEQFAADFELMIDNCLAYNSKDTIFYRAALKLQDQGGAIIRQLARDVESIGFGNKTGLLLQQKPRQQPELSDQEILKEIDSLLSSELENGETYELRKGQLLDILDKAALLKNSIARIKKIKVIRKELGVVKRRMWSELPHGDSSSPRNTVDLTHEAPLADSDIDGSSVIDDEAEPGVPSRPSSPHFVKESLKGASTHPQLERSLANLSKRRFSLSQESDPVASKLSSKQLNKSTSSLRLDPNQMKIDSYFRKTEVQKNEGNSPSRKAGGGSPPPKKRESDSPMTKKGDSSPPAKKREGSSPKRSEVDSSPANQKETGSPPPKKREGSSPPKKKETVSPLAKKRESGSPPPNKGDTGSPTAKKREASSPSSKKTDAGFSCSKKTEAGSPSSKKTEAGSSFSKKTEAGSPSSKKTEAGSPSPKKTEAGSPSSKKTEAGSPSSKKTEAGSPSSKKTEAGSPPAKKKETGSITPTKSDEGNLINLKRDTKRRDGERQLGRGPRKRGRPPKQSLAAIGMIGGRLHKDETEGCNTNKNTTGEIAKEEIENVSYTLHPPHSPKSEGSRSPKPLLSKKAGSPFKKQRNEEMQLNTSNEEEASLPSGDLDIAVDTSLTKESFKVYRQGGEITHETDDDTLSESNSSLTNSEDESETESGADDDGASDSDLSVSKGELPHGTLSGGEDIPLEPLDLVWAKCRGYPWYPALIINPKMPRTGYFHNHVPIPVPPEEVLAHASNYDTPMYLVLFFDQKRTWQWLPRNKLEPLGVNSALDKAKFVQLKKPAERKAVKTAYEKAILHRCRVTGENADLSCDSEENEIQS